MKNAARTVSQATFGDFSRFCLALFQDRFGDLWYLVIDAERVDEYGCSELVAQFKDWDERPAFVPEGLRDSLRAVKS